MNKFLGQEWISMGTGYLCALLSTTSIDNHKSMDNHPSRGHPCSQKEATSMDIHGFVYIRPPDGCPCSGKIANKADIECGVK